MKTGATELSSQSSSQVAVSAVESVPDATAIKRAIIGFASELFACSHCREHFQSMVSTDRCLFGSCEMSANSYGTLQLWLFHLHDIVTRRIVMEYHHLYCTSRSADSHTDANTESANNAFVTSIGKPNCLTNETLAAEIRQGAVWPSVASCPDCLNSAAPAGNPAESMVTVLSLDETASKSLWNDRRVSTHLKQTYWNQNWQFADGSSSEHISTEKGVLDTVGTHPSWTYLLIVVMINGMCVSSRVLVTMLFEMLDACMLGRGRARKRSGSEGNGDEY
jgi:hypothetical protein